MSGILTDPVAQEFSDICRKLGWRMTVSRLTVYNYLRDNYNHPIVDDVWEAVRQGLPTITRESVYRILNDFASKGLIQTLDRADVVARFDSNPKRHDHFFCERCGKVYDFCLDDLDERVRRALQGFGEIDRVEARVRGICQSCLDKEKNASLNLSGDQI